MCLAQKIVTWATLTLVHFGTGPEPAEKVLQTAQAHFQSGCEAGDDRTKATSCFQLAACEYQKLLDDGYDSADIYLNLGNAYLLADDLPQAILAYRGGLLRHPLHFELSDNLESARDLVGYPQDAARRRPPDDGWPPWMPRPAPETLVYLSIWSHGLAWVAIGAWLVFRRKWTLSVAAMLFITAGLLVGWWGYLSYRRDADAERPLVVVNVNGLALRRGNGSLYARHPSLPMVNRGMEAHQINERGGWVQVEFPGGETGWLPSEAVLKP